MSFNNSAPDLGNPYLLYDKSKYTDQEILNSGYFSNTTQGKESNLDFLYYSDSQYDLRQVIVQYDWVNQVWRPNKEIFNDCQDENGSRLENFDQFLFKYEKSPYSTKYLTSKNIT